MNQKVARKKKTSSPKTNKKKKTEKIERQNKTIIKHCSDDDEELDLDFVSSHEETNKKSKNMNKNRSKKTVTKNRRSKKTEKKQTKILEESNVKIQTELDRQLDALQDIDFSGSAVVIKGGEKEVQITKNIENPIRSKLNIITPTKGLTGMLLNPYNTRGLRIDFEFLRSSSLYSMAMNVINIIIKNEREDGIDNIKISNVKLDLDMEMRPFDEIIRLEPKGEFTAKMHVNFGGKLRAITFDVCTKTDSYKSSLSPSIGELVRPVPLLHQQFDEKQKKLTGMNENTIRIICGTPVISKIAQRIVNAFNLFPLGQQDNKSLFRFSGVQLSSSSDILIEAIITPDESGDGGIAIVKVNCSDYMFSGHIINAVKTSLQS